MEREPKTPSQNNLNPGEQKKCYSILTNRTDLYSSRLTKPVADSILWTIDKMEKRHPGDRPTLALIKSPDMATAFVGLATVYLGVGGIQLVLETIELGIRKLSENAPK